MILTNENQAIQVIDHAIDPESYQALFHYLTGHPMLYGWKNVEQSPRQFWHHNFVLPGTFDHHYDAAAVKQELNYANLIRQHTPLSSVAEFVRAIFFGGTEMSRIWLNVQTFGDEGDFHRDYPVQYAKTARSVILYLQKEWDRNWGGDLAILDEQGEILKSVLVKPNRLVAFNGCLRHSARPISRFATEPRRALVFGCEVT